MNIAPFCLEDLSFGIFKKIALPMCYGKWSVVSHGLATTFPVGGRILRPTGQTWDPHKHWQWPNTLGFWMMFSWWNGCAPPKFPHRIHHWILKKFILQKQKVEVIIRTQQKNIISFSTSHLFRLFSEMAKSFHGQALPIGIHPPPHPEALGGAQEMLSLPER